MDDKIRSAFIKAMKHYFSGEEFSKTNELKEGGRKFNKKYFDALETDLTSPPEEKKTKKKAKK